jgi:hypothetical protein
MAARSRSLASLALALALVSSLFAAEGESKAEAKPVGPPQPAIIEGAKSAPLPPRKTDPAWIHYQEGLKLFGEKRLGEAIIAFQNAIDERAELFGRAVSDIDAALATKEAKKAKGSLSGLLSLLAQRDMIPQDYERLHEKAAGSIVAELGLIRETAPSGALRGLVDASLLVAEEGGLSRFGDSTAALRKAASELASYPEAEFQLGKVYLAEGEIRLAELQMLKAVDVSAALERPESRFDMLGELAELYRAKGDMKGYESSLKKIADASQLFSSKDEYYRNSMERILSARGFDTFMKLFRLEETWPVDAYSRLGDYYLQGGRPIATLYFAAAVDATLTRAIGEIRIDEPSYEYSGLADLVSRIQSDRALSDYAERSGLWKNFVLLGEALVASGDRQTARDLWSVVSKARPTELWGKKAAADLARYGRL